MYSLLTLFLLPPQVGSSIAVQICLIQMPVLVLLSEIIPLEHKEAKFTVS